MPEYRLRGVLLVGALLFTACKSSSGGTEAEKGTPSVTASAPSPALQPPAATPAPNSPGSASPLARRTPRDPSTLVAPPLKPPASASSGPLGVRWVLLKAGTGDTLSAPTDTIVADYSAWTTDGKLVFSTYTLDRPGTFNATKVGQTFHSLLAQVKPSGSARFWIPKAALAGWRPESWPDADLIIELAVVAVYHELSTPTGSTAGNAGPLTFPTPDAAGPPKQATRVDANLSYWLMNAPEGAARPVPGQRIQIKFQPWVVQGLEAKPLGRPRPSAVTLERAPGGLGKVLDKVPVGGTARVWLSKEAAKEIVPDAGNNEAILDVTVTGVE